MRVSSSVAANANPRSNQWKLLGILLGGALLVLFFQSLESHEVLFANDGPLGALTAESNRLPGRFTGTWRGLAWLGGAAPVAAPTISMLLATILSPVIFLKVYAPFSLLCVGFSAWLFFRQLRFNPTVCVLGGLAAGLNAHFFSIACWGTGSWNIAVAMSFLALAALSSPSLRQIWAKGIFAGLAVGMGVMEGFDVGAILSVYVGIYAAFRFLTEEAPIGARIVRAMVCEVLVIVFAGFIAVHTLSTLVQTQIEGVASMGQDEETKQQRWNSATQWSLPKKETLQLFVPGLFGYRMTQHILKPDHSSAYWGDIGRDPRIAGLGSDDLAVRQATAALFNVPDEFRANLNTPTRQERTPAIVAITKKAGIYWRYSGSGEFAGILLSLLAFFGLANVWRSQTPYAKPERAAVIFWGAVALFSLLMAWGRYGFLYRLFYHLPYFSTIRNPIKFLTPFHIAWVIVAAYGMEVLYRSYLRATVKRADFFPEHLLNWWGKAPGFDRKWTIFALLLLGASILGLFIFNASHNALTDYLEDQAFAAQDAAKIANYSFVQAAWFVGFLALSVLVVTGIISGAWSGPRIKWAWTFLAVVLLADLARADQPWVRYFDYGEKYSANPIVDFLQDQPYEHRVIGKLEPRGPGSGITPGFGELYFFWIQNDFPYHNIQTLDFAQAPHMPDLDRDYLKAFELKGTDIRNTDLLPAIRLWQLTNTRYILASASGVDLLNARGRAVNASFQIRSLYNIVRKPEVLQPNDVGDLTVEEGSKGAFALIDFPNALPRVKLYSNWEVPTNDNAALATLASPAFDPLKTVLVSPETPPPQSPTVPTADPGMATITEYRPKFVQIQADAKTPSILLFNDRVAPEWQVSIDHQRGEILRCNYIMRGVFLSPGNHIIEFRFKPSLKTLYVTLCAIVVGIAVAGYLIATRPPSVAPAENPLPPRPPAPAPAAAPLPAQAVKPVAASAAPPRRSGKKKARKV
jgi:hypothetical protein